MIKACQRFHECPATGNDCVTHSDEQGPNCFVAPGLSNRERELVDAARALLLIVDKKRGYSSASANLRASLKAYEGEPDGTHAIATETATERGVAGDKCESGNECGRLGCPECQK